MPRLILDRSRCTGLGLCEAYAEHVFEIQQDGKLALLTEQIDEQDLDAVQQACESCPTEALRLEA
ncbi:ferredoxin [Branchiibius hedensis]|uniref:Ferredoxin n=1 Tax=Branchiibius hedensis TaxID=672460 RepID=A0A2Y9C0K0_9MICO|nr:ferredoxin [Branchiibius hedensis]PWJ23945.1 ferredoxin [Branchiibius hedensis]SSA32763.1 ferredoxin [Branchiibius hedensis]